MCNCRGKQQEPQKRLSIVESNTHVVKHWQYTACAFFQRYIATAMLNGRYMTVHANIILHCLKKACLVQLLGCAPSKVCICQLSCCCSTCDFATLLSWEGSLHSTQLIRQPHETIVRYKRYHLYNGISMTSLPSLFALCSTTDDQLI